MSEPDYRFEIAISFAGGNKLDLVRRVAELLREKVGDGKVFFYEWFEAELAGPDAQVVLQSYYPEILEEMERYTDALAVVQYAWGSHKQHRDMIAKIQRYSEDHFETVASRIDENTERIFVCQFCGSTLNEFPEDTCPICEYPAAHYRLIDPEHFRA